MNRRSPRAEESAEAQPVLPGHHESLSVFGILDFRRQFPETTRVLTEASASGAMASGPQENVIIGHLIHRRDGPRVRIAISWKEINVAYNAKSACKGWTQPAYSKTEARRSPGVVPSQKTGGLRGSTTTAQKAELGAAKGRAREIDVRS